MSFQAVLFDCDGVLVDSEPITNSVLHTMLVERGWPLSAQECWDLFVGHTVRSRRELIEQHTRQPWSETWLQTFMQRRNQALQQSLQIIVGAEAAVAHAHRHSGGQVAVASGADRQKVEMMLAQVGLLPYFEGRVFSGHETPRSKPHPDVYLAAASHLGVDPRRCLVVEDTVTGVQAGVAAGATVWGYATLGQGPELRRAGAAHVMHDMAELLQAPFSAAPL
jgi:HAD superfamily hydrolase (TIGR01509 family)